MSNASMGSDESALPAAIPTVVLCVVALCQQSIQASVSLSDPLFRSMVYRFDDAAVTRCLVGSCSQTYGRLRKFLPVA